MPSPLRWVIAAAAALLLAAAAFVGGWVTGKNAPKSSPVVYGQPVAPAPADWTEWAYPNAREGSRSTGGGASLGNVKVGSLHTAQLTTPDPFEQVLAHYAQKFGQPGFVSAGGTGNSGGIRYLPGGMEAFTFTLADTTRPGVKGKVIAYRTSNYDVVIDVSRTDAEKQTHIVISYLPHP